MPYKIKKQGGKYVVYNSDTGKSAGKSATRAEAVDHMKALYANVGKKDFDGWVYEYQLTQEQAAYDAVGGLTGGKACANCQFFDSPNGCLVVQGDISPTGLSRMWEAETADIPDDPQQVEIVNWEDMLGVKANNPVDIARSWWNKLFTDSGEEPVEGLRPIYLTKDLDGSLRAHMVFSNNFIDRHDQIIPEVVHNNTIEWCDKTGIYPDFEIWHRGQKSKWGKGDLITRTGNFTVIHGLVDSGKEAIAEALARSKDTGVSNGYFALYTEDRKEFVAWYPFEVSALPAIASANVWMDDQYFLEQEGFLMTPENKAILKAKGVDDAFMDALEKDILGRSTQVTASGVASKEVESTTGTSTEPVTAETLIAVLSKVMEPINARFEAIETGVKALATIGQKSKDDIVADEILARVGQNPALVGGFKATEQNPSPDPNVDGNLDSQHNWLGDELDRLMKAGGVPIAS